MAIEEQVIDRSSTGIDLTMWQDIKDIEAHEASIAAKKDLLASKIPPGCAVMSDRSSATVAVSEGGKLKVFALIILSEVHASGA